MTEEQNTEGGTAPSEPARDPMNDPAPPANPEPDQDAIEKGEEQLEKISGN